MPTAYMDGKQATSREIKISKNILLLRTHCENRRSLNRRSTDDMFVYITSVASVHYRFKLLGWFHEGRKFTERLSELSVHGLIIISHLEPIQT